MARQAQRLAVCHVVAFTTLADWHDVVCVRFPAVGAHPEAPPALPSVARQHGEPPRLVGLVAVAACRCIGPARLVTPWASSPDTGGDMCRYPIRHRGGGLFWKRPQLLNITTPTVPVEFVVADTIFKNSVPNTSSGRAYARPSVLEGASVRSAAEPSDL